MSDTDESLPLPVDPMDSAFLQDVQELADRLGITLEEYRALSKTIKPEDTVDIETPQGPRKREE